MVPAEGGAPHHNGALVNAAGELKRDRGIDWSLLAQWDELPRIRQDLDSLPHPAAATNNPLARPACPVSVRSEAERRVRVNGRETTLTVPQFDVIRVLIDRFPDGATKDDLNRLSRHTDGRGILVRLSRDSLWKDVIAFPGSPGAGGYRLTVPGDQ